jgi:hypothetical protein
MTVWGGCAGRSHIQLSLSTIPEGQEYNPGALIGRYTNKCLFRITTVPPQSTTSGEGRSATEGTKGEARSPSEQQRKSWMSCRVAPDDMDVDSGSKQVCAVPAIYGTCR